MITHLSVREQIDLISKKEIKVEELFQEYLSNIEKLNPKLNAIVSLRDKDWIIDNAKAQDAKKLMLQENKFYLDFHLFQKNYSTSSDCRLLMEYLNIKIIFHKMTR